MAERGLRNTYGDIKNAAGKAKQAGLLSGKNSRIGNGLAIILILLALIADAFSLIPFAGGLVGPVFWIGISLFFWSKGFGFLNMRRVATSAISMVSEMVPIVEWLPTIITGMIVVIIFMRLEDKTGKSLLKPMSKGQALNHGGRREPGSEGQGPLNEEGVREPSKHITRV